MSEPRILIHSTTFQFTLADVQRIRRELEGKSVQTLIDDFACLINAIHEDPDFESRFPKP